MRKPSDWSETMTRVRMSSRFQYGRFDPVEWDRNWVLLPS